MRRIPILLTILLCCAEARSQRLDPADYIYPIRNVAGLYSANFGEMRPAHFHAGIDIKTDGAERKPLVAVADGYVSRITVTPGGYGRALYLTLRNGTTAVYGHLRQFRDDIEERLRTERYARRANSVDLWFAPGEWPVKQGDPIGFSGNTGSSMGPHLHFELRRTQDQRYLNIVREGIVRPKDDLPPRILRIHYIEIDSLNGVPVHGRPESYAVVRTPEGRYRLTREDPVGMGRKGYFVAEVTDRRNEVSNTFGIWRLTASIDGEPYFEYRMDGFTPDLSRCCDAVSYYPLQLVSRNEAIRLAQLEGAPDCFYPAMRERGLLRIEPGETHRIRIEVEDDCGNRSHLEFPVYGRNGRPLPAVDSTDRALRRDRTETVAIGREIQAVIPAGALYESNFCRPERRPAPTAPRGVVVLSPAYRILDTATPLYRSATVAIRADIPRPLQLRAVVARRTVKGALAFVGGHYAAGQVTVSTRSTGEWAVVADTLPPEVRPRFKENADLGRAEALEFRATDNFAGVVACTLFVDDRWVPCDRLPMQGIIRYVFDTPAAGRNHRFRLSVVDGCGNTACCEGMFYR